MDNLKTKLSAFFEKLKKLKRKEVLIAVGLAVILAIAYFAFLVPKSSEKPSQAPQNDITSQTFSSSSEYTEYLENKLENVITSVKGAGDVKVILSLEKGFEYIYATEEETKTTSNGTSITTVSILMVDGQPVIKEEIYPLVGGVVVIASGAEDVGVRMNILSIIQTVVKVDNSKINILDGEF